MTRDEEHKKEMRDIGIPLKSFLYTLEQVAAMLEIQPKMFAARYVYYEGRTPGVKKGDQFGARNIARVDEPPEWRIVDMEVLRWFKHKGFRLHERGWLQS